MLTSGSGRLPVIDVILHFSSLCSMQLKVPATKKAQAYLYLVCLAQRYQVYCLQLKRDGIRQLYLKSCLQFGYIYIGSCFEFPVTCQMT